MNDSKGNEPQSYGSEKEWVTGETGQEVNRQKGNPNSQQGDFYSSHHESEESAPDQGGRTSPVQSSEYAAPSGPGSDGAETGVTVKESGAKRGSYFKDRDYE